MPSRRRIFIVSLSVLVTVVGVVGLYKFNKSYFPIWNSNNINVRVDEPLEHEKVKIEFSNYLSTINVFSALYSVITENTSDTELYEPKRIILFTTAVK